jgi:hypothetical protein
MMVPSLEGTEKGDAMLHCGIASAGRMVPASRTFRAFDVLIALSGPDKFSSSAVKRQRPNALANCLLRLDFDASSAWRMKNHSGLLRDRLPRRLAPLRTWTE